MTARKYLDSSPIATLTASITNSDTTFTVSSLSGFPTSFPYTATLDLGTSSAEVVLVTAASGPTVTVTRNYNGLGAFAHTGTSGTFTHTAVAKDLQEANDHINTGTGVHGLASGVAVVGTTTTQTLSNKTLVSPVFQGTTNGTVPTGTIVMTGLSGAPDANWALCDGSEVPRAGIYANLYSLMGDAFGAGDGSTTFNLPSLTQTFPRGADPAGPVEAQLGANGGAATSTHTHPLSNNGQAKIGFGTNQLLGDFSTVSYTVTSKQTGTWSSATATGTSLGAGLHGATDSTSVPTVPPFLSLNFIIKL